MRFPARQTHAPEPRPQRDGATRAADDDPASGKAAAGSRGNVIAKEDGAAAVEFAIIAMPFLAVLVSIVEVGVDFMIFSQLDYAVQKASQNVRYGVAQTSGLTAEQFKSGVLCPNLVGLQCSSVHVKAMVIKNQSDWNALSPHSFDPSNPKWCIGGAADTVLVQVAFPVPLASMIWAGSASVSNGVRYYVSSATFRNDPFAALATPTAGC